MLNLLDHPACFSPSDRTCRSSWAEHFPFAAYLIGATRPATLVELGTHAGFSYCGFCQVVRSLNLEARCFAVDTWEGDEHSGSYGPEVLAELRAHHDPRYGGISTLLQATFDEALGQFPDRSIDLLHIDGFHTYDAVRHDFDSWLPKLSRRGVVLLHDTNVRERDFGVWRFWLEVRDRYPSFEFIHGHGLGVLAVGEEIPEGLLPLLQADDREAALIRLAFSRLGSYHSLTLLKSLGEEHSRQLGRRAAELADRLAERDRHAASLADRLAELEGHIARQDEHIAGHLAHASDQAAHVARQDEHIARIDQHAAGLLDQVAELQRHIARQDGHIANHLAHASDQAAHIARQDGHIANHLAHASDQAAHIARQDGHIAGHLAHASGQDEHIARIDQHAAGLLDQVAELQRHIARQDGLLAGLGTAVDALDGRLAGLAAAMDEGRRAEREDALRMSRWQESEVAARDIRIAELWELARRQEDRIASLSAELEARGRPARNPIQLASAASRRLSSALADLRSRLRPGGTPVPDALAGETTAVEDGSDPDLRRVA
ncbi:class I SAM-dependent methyltransferase [Tautonia plasticadhaerens]|uniref:Chromosome partition protein Smc n=1 Tax=Tautonia plasticadhaerens TaxID=2527974 RepID=A0A518HFI1_9BACT|nr:class I SAM-dependent methyltransferase [Tautonia plasticadhaerens]QDV39604.1 Chromosome partition protein Smc [Tautonia plasticadhaerens]